MKYRVVSAIVCSILLSLSALAQVPSRFDFSGNLSFNGATLPNSPSSTQVRAFGWQTSGVTRFSRWFAVTSQFGSGYASADSIQLLGYTGSGTMIHYSMLVGPRITIPTRSRFSPFIEGLAGADRASTSIVSMGTPVTGRELQTAYAFGGGAQINVSRHFGLNFEGQYFGTQHTTAFTGWEPSHFQIAAGIVIRMLGRGPQIAEQRPVPMPTPTDGVQSAPAQTVAQSTENEVTTVTTVASIQPVVANPVTPTPVQPQAMAASNAQITTAQPAVTTSFVATPTPTAVAVQPVAEAKLVAPAPQVVAPAAQTSKPTRQLSEATPPLVRRAPQTVASVPAVPGVNTSQRPVQSFAQPVQPVVTSARATPPQIAAQPQSQTQPISLGEYARRLREKKQQEQKQ